MRKATIYHNPRCSKSRATLALLRARGLDIEIIDYLKTPPSIAEIKTLARFLGCDIAAMMRKKEPAYKENNLAQEHDAEKLARAIHTNPILLERPIVIYNNKAVFGRPPENIESIL